MKMPEPMMPPMTNIVVSNRPSRLARGWEGVSGAKAGSGNHDGRVDFCVTNFSDDYNTLYRNDGDGGFSDVSFGAGIANPTIPFLGWGTAFLDYDNDGWLDLFFANGHVYPGVDKQDWGTTWQQRPLLKHQFCFRAMHSTTPRDACRDERRGETSRDA